MFFSVKSGFHPLNSSFRETQGSLHLVDKVGGRAKDPDPSTPGAGFAAYSATAHLYCFIFLFLPS